PEDQGGDDVKPPPPAPPAAVVAKPAADVVVAELPAKKKAKLLVSKAIAMLRDGDFAGAEPVLVKAVIVDPAAADGWRHLGIARAQLGDKDGARRAYKKYLALAPNAPDADQVRAILGP